MRRWNKHKHIFAYNTHRHISVSAFLPIMKLNLLLAHNNKRLLYQQFGHTISTTDVAVLQSHQSKVPTKKPWLEERPFRSARLFILRCQGLQINAYSKGVRTYISQTSVSLSRAQRRREQFKTFFSGAMDHRYAQSAGDYNLQQTAQVQKAQ